MKPAMNSRQFPSAEQGQAVESDRLDPEFEATMDFFRGETRIWTDRSDEYWSKQHAAIMNLIGMRQSVRRIGLNWALAAALLLFGFGLFLFRVPAQPVPDYVGGYDQELLLEVERALDREVPGALEPALLLCDEIEQNRIKKPTL